MRTTTNSKRTFRLKKDFDLDILLKYGFHTRWEGINCYDIWNDDIRYYKYDSLLNHKFILAGLTHSTKIELPEDERKNDRKYKYYEMEFNLNNNGYFYLSNEFRKNHIPDTALFKALYKEGIIEEVNKKGTAKN